MFTFPGARTTGTLLVILGVLGVLGVLAAPLPAMGQAQETSPADPAAETSDQLVLRQGQLSDSLKRLEGMMLKMAEYEAAENPQRAALLREALAQSKNRSVTAQMEALVELLGQQRYQQAVDNQQLVVTDLKQLLELLLREERADQLKDEQQRLRNYLEQVDRIIRQQRSLRARTEGGESLAPLSDKQQELADQTGELNRQIDQNEGTVAPGQDGAPSDSAQPPSSDDSQGDPSESRPSPNEDPAPDDDPSQGDDTEPADDQPGDTAPGDDGSPEDSDPPPATPSDSAPSEGSPADPSPGQPAPGDPPQPSPGGSSPPSQGGPGQSPGQSTPSDAAPPGAQQQQSFPGRQRLAEAQKRMEQAQQRLEEAKRQDATQEQAEALRLLQQAKAELEEILRQLREEEIERTLAMLEGRFRKMLQMQIQVNEDTKQLDQVATDARDRQFAVRTNQVSVAQRGIAIEAEKALMLLKEEGSSVAFPEAVQEIRDDMEQAADWIGEQKVGSVTQILQDGIVEALEEMLEALQQAQRDAQQRRDQPPPPGGGAPEDQPLVDALAELKMIRALQIRINRRTDQFSQLLTNRDDPVGQAVDQDILGGLQELAERELRVHEITRDIVVGRNE